MIDIVNHPPHYKSDSGIESIDVIEGFGLNFRLGNTIKYILRHNKKGKPLEDLKKQDGILIERLRSWNLRRGNREIHKNATRFIKTNMQRKRQSCDRKVLYFRQ